MEPIALLGIGALLIIFLILRRGGISPEPPQPPDPPPEPPPPPGPPPEPPPEGVAILSANFGPPVFSVYESPGGVISLNYHVGVTFLVSNTASDITKAQISGFTGSHDINHQWTTTPCRNIYIPNGQSYHEGTMTVWTTSLSPRPMAGTYWVKMRVKDQNGVVLSPEFYVRDAFRIGA